MPLLPPMWKKYWVHFPCRCEYQLTPFTTTLLLPLRHSVGSVAEEDRPPRTIREESPPTGRTGDQAQAWSGRPLALKQKRHVSARPMKRANLTRKGVGVNLLRVEGARYFLDVRYSI